jgi:acetylornithine/N-succinyldiaminopimelate aminotransferase
VAATDNPAIVAPVNQTDNIIFLPFNDESALEDCFKSMGSEIAAVIIEGIQGVGGINEASASFLQAIGKLCKKYDAVFVADEIQCGYGRSGKFFSQDYAGVDADIYTMAKGMGNGFPVAGIIISPQLKPKMGLLGTTFGGNHLACAAALAVLEVIQQENLIANAAETGAYLMSELRKIPQLQRVRGKGLMIGFDVPEQLKDLRKNLLWHQRIFTGEAKPNTIRLLPSLALRKKDADEFLEAITEEILAMEQEGVEVGHAPKTEGR